MMGMGQSPPEETGKSVRRQYHARIQNFLSLSACNDLLEADIYEMGLVGGDALGELFQWGQQMMLEKAGLEERLEKTRRRNSQLSHTVESLGTQVEGLIQELQAKQRELEQAAEAHKREVWELKAKHEEKVGQLVLRHSNAETKLVNEKNSLQAQLLSPPDKSSFWPDEKLKQQFRETCRIIGNVTASIAMIANESGLVLGNDLDPDGSLDLVRKKVHFWLRPRIWAIFKDGFFGLPFGFGAFGLGEGRTEIMDVYQAWRSRLGDSGTQGTDGLDIFNYDETANRWRSVTFQTLAASVEAGERSSTGIVRLGYHNVAHVAEQTMSMLSTIVGSSPQFGELKRQIHEAASLAFEVALQFGINPAQLVLLSAGRNETVTIDKKQGFIDCEDEKETGDVVRVALAVTPGLLRIGDGRSETTQRHTIWPCEVFAGR